MSGRNKDHIYEVMPTFPNLVTIECCASCEHSGEDIDYGYECHHKETMGKVKDNINGKIFEFKESGQVEAYNKCDYYERWRYLDDD
jgi:hypothetical protein